MCVYNSHILTEQLDNILNGCEPIKSVNSSVLFILLLSRNTRA